MTRPFIPVLGAALLLVTLAIPGPAQALDVSPTPDPAGDYCASRISDDGVMGDPVCFDTDAHVQQYLDGVTDSAAPLSSHAAKSTTSTASTSATVILGTVYKNSNYRGASLTLWGTGSVCKGTRYGFSSLASGWNNSISSGIAATGCWMTMYDKTSYRGDSLTCTPRCAAVGSLMNDKVKSLLFTPTGTFG